LHTRIMRSEVLWIRIPCITLQRSEKLGEKAENHGQKEKLSFGESDKGPYSMCLKRGNRKQESTRPLMTLKVCKIRDQSAIKYDLIAPVAR
jgi:hypothetical protein